MSRSNEPLTRADFHSAAGVLLVTREPPAPPTPVKGQPPFVGGNPAEGPEILLAVWDDGSVTALNGHVDLGTGLRTALAQIVAEELDISATRCLGIAQLMQHLFERAVRITRRRRVWAA